MIRHWLLPAALVTPLFAIPAAPAQARMLGGVSIDTSSPPVVSPGPWGGYYGYSAYLRRWNASTGQWNFHFIIAYSQADCLRMYNQMLGQGWQFNPNPGIGLCQPHAGWYGHSLVNPGGSGTGVSHNWSTEAVRNYEVGVRELRERYRIEEFNREQELLIKTIEAMPGAIVEGEGQGGGR